MFNVTWYYGTIAIPNNRIEIGSHFVEGCETQLNDYSKLIVKMTGSNGNIDMRLYDQKRGNMKYRKHRMTDAVEQDIDVNRILLDNGYEFKFECPLRVTEMQHSRSDQAFCRVCAKNVKIVNDIEDFNAQIEQGECVSFDPQQLFQVHHFEQQPMFLDRRAPRRTQLQYYSFGNVGVRYG